MPIIARKFPEQFARSAYVVENRPIAKGDSPGLIAKKLLKSLLSTPWALAGLHRLVALLEAVRLPQPALRRLYRALLGLHLFRGFRRTWREL
jgi:hypothetical protein